MAALTLLLLGGTGWGVFYLNREPKPVEAPVTIGLQAPHHPSQIEPAVITADSQVFPVSTVTIPKRSEPPPFNVSLPPPLSDSDLLQFLSQSYDVGRQNGPDVAMAKAMLQTPVARATDQWLLSRSRVALPFQWYTAFHSTYPDWPVTPALRRKAEIALVTGTVSETVKRTYFAATPPETTTGRIYWARTLLNTGETAKAITLIQPIWHRERLLPSTEQQIRIDFAQYLSRQDHRNRMIFLMSSKSWEAALRVAKDAGKGAEAIVKAHMAVISNAKTAQAQLDALPKDNQTDWLVFYARLLLLKQQSKHKEAGEIISMLAGSTGNQKLSPIECRNWQVQQRFVIRELMDENLLEEAYRTAAAPISKLGCVHNDADFLAGWISFRFLGRIEQAEMHFNSLAANAISAAQQARAGYWQGRLAEHRGDTSAAEAAYQQASRHWSTFYGQLASEKRLSTPFVLPGAVGISPEVQSSFEAMMPVQALHLLAEGGQAEIARSLYADLANTLPDEPHLKALAALAAKQQNARAVLTVARIADRRGFNLGVQAYPTFGIPDIAEKVAGIEIPLLYAIAHQESAFDPKARSAAGALGLMQLMPATAKTAAARTGVAFDIDRLTLDPSYNARLGAAHLRDLLSAWNGSLILSFAAYNAGGGNVKKWIAAHGDLRFPTVDTVDWIERIPFYETRHYVQRISENLMIYRRVMNSQQPSLFAREVTTSSGLAPVPHRQIP